MLLPLFLSPLNLSPPCLNLVGLTASQGQHTHHAPAQKREGKKPKMSDAEVLANLSELRAKLNSLHIKGLWCYIRLNFLFLFFIFIMLEMLF